MEISAADLRRCSRSSSLTAFCGVDVLAEVKEVLKVDLRVGLGGVEMFTEVEEVLNVVLDISAGWESERGAEEVVVALLRRAAGTAWISISF